MSYVEILVLRHLLPSPAHGYELRKRVEASTGITLHNNALYPALRRFEESGAVVRRSEANEGRPTRHVYSLTDRGRQLLHDLLAELPQDLAQDDGEFLTRVGQFSLLTPGERKSVLNSRLDALRSRAHHSRNLKRTAGDDPWSAAVTSALTSRTDDEIGWIEQLLGKVEQ